MSEVETKTVAEETKEVKATTVTAKKKGMSVKDLATLGLLTGVLLLMAFTPLGYFHTFGLDISLMMIPVGIGAMLMGPKAGAWLGFIFGAVQHQPCAHIPAVYPYQNPEGLCDRRDLPAGIQTG